MIFKKTSEEEERKKEDENCFKSRLKCDKRLRRLIIYRKKIVILEICKALQNVFCTIFVIILAHLFWNMYENPNRVEPFFAFKRVNDSMIQ